MSRSRIFQLIYAGIALFGTYLLVARLVAGAWMSALLPLLVVAFCVYRLLTLEG